MAACCAIIHDSIFMISAMSEVATNTCCLGLASGNFMAGMLLIAAYCSESDSLNINVEHFSLYISSSLFFFLTIGSYCFAKDYDKQIALYCRLATTDRDYSTTVIAQKLEIKRRSLWERKLGLLKRQWPLLSSLIVCQIFVCLSSIVICKAGISLEMSDQKFICI